MAVNSRYLQSGKKSLVLIKNNPKTKKKIQKVTQIKPCSAQRPNTEQPPSVMFRLAWYQTMLGGGPAHGQTPYIDAISNFKGGVSWGINSKSLFHINLLIFFGLFSKL